MEFNAQVRNVIEHGTFDLHHRRSNREVIHTSRGTSVHTHNLQRVLLYQLYTCTCTYVRFTCTCTINGNSIVTYFICSTVYTFHLHLMYSAHCIVIKLLKIYVQCLSMNSLHLTGGASLVSRH